MKTYSSKRGMILLSILAPLLVSLACNTLQPGAPSSPLPPSVEKTFEATVVFGSGPFDLRDPVAGLSDLTGYKATLTLSFAGTNAGQPNKWSKTYVMLTTKEPAARQLTIDKTGDLSDRDAVFMAETDGTDYQRRGQNPCTANAIVKENSLALQMEPAGFLNGVIGAEEAGAETINEVATNRYTFDERAFGQLGLAQSTGEMWVATDGGFIVKYLLTTEATADYFGEGIEGTLTWDYELTDVNKPVTIEVPTDCPAGMINAPRLPDATDILTLPGVLTFNSTTSLADAAAFYQKQLPDLGWKLAGEPSMTDTTALMDFTQKDKTLTVIITTEAGVTNVEIESGVVQK